MSNPEFERKLDAILLEGDLDVVIALLAHMGVKCDSRANAEIALHKARTARLSLPKEARDASRHWLVTRGEMPMGH